MEKPHISAGTEVSPGTYRCNACANKYECREEMEKLPHCEVCDSISWRLVRPAPGKGMKFGALESDNLNQTQVYRKSEAVLGKETGMSEISSPKGRTQFVWVKDKAGNEFVCPIEELKDPKNVSQDELKNCIDDARTPQPFAGG